MKRFIILTLARSGSNNLVNLLNRHPQITNYGEVLGEWTIPYRLHQKYGLGGKSDAGYLDYIYRSRLFFYLGQIYNVRARFRSGKPINFKFRNQVQLIGVKDFSSNFYRRNISSYLKDREDIQVISLYRENTLKRFISHKKMEKGGAVALASKEDNPVKELKNTIRLDIDQLISELDVFDKQLTDHHAMVNELQPNRILTICYEDMFAANERVTKYRDEVFEFLGVPNMGLQFGHKKILPDDISKVVENYDEMCEALKNTKYHHLID
jgi:hypothetical protein